ncbi:MAG TPA: protein kinase [Thermogutta sp.]|nr:protein kinase [Thermogutta sp.]
MPDEPTIPQGGAERRLSQAMSLQGRRPPADVPGYDPERLLGAGAYGEVWVALERNTGRRVAIKFYSHRGGLDWSLLSREVEKLAFLCADRYVVQLIAVGWDSEPPYYVMEFMEQGSLAERLAKGPLPATEAVRLFREVAIGLLHAHNKGVLHCDLKPGNVLLDQDGKPRLADFGQSRLSHEQLPALGTLFYMAPEQADLNAVPDARWDVYALGALFYCMLTGHPPHRDQETAKKIEEITDLEERLAAYRRLIEESGIPTDHRSIPGVDRGLAAILERCLAPDPNQRFPNIQSVLVALETWAAERARRPLVVLGFVGPALLLLVFALFAWRGFATTVNRSRDMLIHRALENNRLMAQYVADLAGKELRRRFEAVEQLGGNARFQDLIRQVIRDPEYEELSRELSRADLPEEEAEVLRRRFRSHPLRAALQREFSALIPPWMRPEESGESSVDDVASWFFCDPNGISTARVPESVTIGRNYAWRSFFTGLDRDMPREWRPAQGEHLRSPKLSAVFRSEATGLWIVAVAAPVIDLRTNEFLGVVALTVRVTRFVELEGTPAQFPVLVELRPGDHTGMILQHPLFDQVLLREQRLPERFQNYRLSKDALPPDLDKGAIHDPRAIGYRDPLAADPEGSLFARDYLAQAAPVRLSSGKDSQDTGWMVIVQEDYDVAVRGPLEGFQKALVRYGLISASLVAAILLGLWTLTVRLLNEIHENHLLSRSEYLLRETSRGSHRVVPRVITDHPTSTAPWVSDSIPSGPSIESQGGTVATSRTVPEASEQEQ